MNATFHRFLMAGDKWMPKIHLRQPEFTYSSGKTKKKNAKIQRNKRHQLYLPERTGQGMFPT